MRLQICSITAAALMCGSLVSAQKSALTPGSQSLAKQGEVEPDLLRHTEDPKTKVNLALAPHAPESPTINPGVPWPATDALGRSLPTPAEVGPVKAGRFVGIF